VQSLGWNSGIALLCATIAIISWRNHELRRLSRVYAALAFSLLLMAASYMTSGEEVRLVLLKASFGAAVLGVVILINHVFRSRVR
jgi:hypothetical protein